jgi:hypothetical protein
MKTKQSEDDKFVKRTIDHINDTSKWASNRINELNTVDELCDYMRSKYLTPYNLGGTSIIDNYYTLLDSNKIHSTKDVDKFFKKHLNQKDEPKTKIKNHDTSDKVLKTIFDIAEKSMEFKHNKKFDTTEAEELFKKIEEKIKAKKPVRKDMVDRMAQNIIDNPMYKGITKNKLKKYGFEIFNNFNKRYPDLMNEMFKKEEIEKLLKKKYEKAVKVGNIKK